MCRRDSLVVVILGPGHSPRFDDKSQSQAPSGGASLRNLGKEARQ